MRGLMVLGAALAVSLASPAAAESMTAGEFLARAEPMLKKNKLQLVLSMGEVRKIMGELGGAAKRSRVRLEADRAAGRRVTTCIPPKGKAEVDGIAFVAHLKAIPPAQRGQSLDQAFASYMAKIYPCPS